MDITFNFDNDIANTCVAVESALNRAVINFADRYEHVSFTNGQSLDSILRQIFKNKTEKQFLQIKEYFYSYFYEHCLEQTVLYPGKADYIADLFLKGEKLYIVSQWPKNITDKILAYFDIDSYFAGITYDKRICAQE